MVVSIAIDSIPAEAVECYQAAAVRRDDRTLWIDNESDGYRACIKAHLKNRIPTDTKQIAPPRLTRSFSRPVEVPRENWPAAVNALAMLAKPQDRGIGDVIARNLGFVGEAFKAAAKRLGVDCGCDARRDRFNVMYPL